jgi:hypothetical protein
MPNVECRGSDSERGTPKKKVHRSLDKRALSWKEPLVAQVQTGPKGRKSMAFITEITADGGWPG